MTAPGGSSRQVKIIISADVAQAIRALGQTEQGLGNVGQQAEQAARRVSTMGDVMKGTLAAAGIQAGLTGVVDGLKSVVSGGIAYEKSLNTLGAVSGASASQMQAVADTAKQLGADIKIPGASAQSVAAAMTELAKGGLSAEEAMAAARGTMILAAAAQIDGAQAAEIQANALNTFGLKADQAGRVANVLANVANKSSGEITDFSQALAASGSVANMMGMSIEDTATALGLFANAGIKGSDAGTTLKTSITQLLNPSKESQAAIEELGLTVWDSQGNFVGYRSIVDQLSQAQGRMTQQAFAAAAAQVLGTDAVRAGAIVAAGGTAAWDEMAASIGNVNGAADAAAANTKGLSGVIEALKNTVDTASLSLFEALSPAIGEVATALTAVVTPAAEGLAPLLSAIANAATGSLAPALQGLAGFLGAVAEPLGAVIGWFSDLPGPIGTGVFALGTVIALRGPLVATFTTAAGSLTTLVATLRGTAGAAAAGSAGLAGWIASLRAASGAAATFGVVAKGALSVLGGPIGLAIVGVTTALSFMGSTTDDVAVSTADFSQAIDENTGALKGNADAIIAKAAADSGSFDAIEAIGGTVKDYTAALMGNADAQNTIHTLLLDQATAAVKNSDAWGRMVAGGQTAGKSARDVADGILATGNASKFATDELDAVLLASQRFAADSDNLTTAQRQTGQALEVTGTAAGTAAGGIDTLAGATQQAEQTATPFSDALKEIRSAASEADAAAQFLNITLLQMAGGQVTAEQSARANAAAFREVGQSARDLADANDTVAEKSARLTELTDALGTELDGQVVTQQMVDQAARALADAEFAAAAAVDKQKDSLDKAAESARTTTADAYNLAASQGNLRGATDAAVQTMIEQRKQFIQSAVDAGIERQAAEELANQQGLIPENVRTQYEQIGLDSSISRAAALNAELDRMNNKTVRYTVIGTTIYQYQTVSQGTANSAEGPGRADGGIISGPGGPRDDKIPAMLSDGEFVVNAQATTRHRALLEGINAGKFARGGLVRLAAGGAANGSKPKGDAQSAEVSATVTAPDPALFEKSWNEIVAATKTAWDSGISPVLGDLSATNAKTGAETIALSEGAVQPAWRGISDSIRSSWDGTIAPTFGDLNAGSGGVGVQQTVLRDTWSQAWQQNQSSTTSTWNVLGGSTFPEMRAGLQSLGSEQQTLAGVTSAAWAQIGAVISSTYSGQIVPAWAGVKGFAQETGSFFNGIKAGISSAAASAVGDIGKIKNSLNDFFNFIGGRTPGAANGGRVGDVIAMAGGGPITVGTGPRSDDVLIRVSRGEYVVNAEQTAKHRDTLDAINSGTKGFADGGSVGDRISGKIQTTILDKVHAAVEAAVNKAIGSTGGGSGSGSWVEQIQKKIKDAQTIVTFPGGGGTPYTGPISGGVGQWLGTVLQALAITGQSPGLAGTVLYQMQTESGGNPNAINLWDSNAMRGTPSIGLMQVIGPTFAAYRHPGLSANIYDPLANIVAAIRYTIGRYGGVANGMRGHAYDNGGVLPPGYTLAYNGTGRDEYVFTREQMTSGPALTQAQIAGVVQQVIKGLPTTYTGGNHGGVHIHGDMVNNTGSDLTRQLAWAALTAGG